MIIAASERVPLEKCPALVLNADFRPLSYYPLSLWCWQDAVKSVFLEKVSIVSNYKRKIRSPSFEMSLPSVIALQSFIKPSERPNFTRFKVFLSDKFTCQFCGDKYDLIISNPPYIKHHEINGLEKDIKNHEPKVALDGGIDGYNKIRLIIEKSSILIKKKGKLFLELGINQTRETLKILNLNGFCKTKVIKDLASKNRCIVSTKI